MLAFSENDTFPSSMLPTKLAFSSCLVSIACTLKFGFYFIAWLIQIKCFLQRTSQSRCEDVNRPMVVVVQHPGASREEFTKGSNCSKAGSEYALKSSLSSFNMSSGKSSALPRSRSLSLVPDSGLCENSQIPWK